MELPLLFTIVFLTVFTIYFFFAIYILHLNQKAALNRMFFAVCISLCIWTFGFAMSIDSPDAASALFWRRGSVIGWATLYANILIFLLILTGRARLLRKWWLILLLYAPAVLNIVVFAFLKSTVSYEYRMVKVAFGWTNMSVLAIWDILFYLYYIGYIAACIVVAWRWKKNAADQNVVRQANMIIASFIIALILGSITDVVLSATGKILLPQMAPVFILIPVMVFFFCINRYGLMNSDTDDSSQVILNKQTRTKLFEFVAGIFIITGIASFLYIFAFSGDTLISAILIGGTLILLGFAMFMFQLIRNETMRYSLNLALSMLSVPTVTLLYISYGSVTSWVFPIIFMLVALVFNKRSMLVGVSIVSLLTQVYLWVTPNSEPCRPSDITYIVRICFILAVVFLGLHINKIYISKLKENANQLALQKLVSDVSLSFARQDKSALDDNIELLLRGTGEFFGADRAHVVLISRDQNTMTMCYEWCRPGIPPEMDRIGPVSVDDYKLLIDLMSDHKSIYHQDIKKAPDNTYKAFCGSNLIIDKNITSTVSTPIQISGKMYGFVGYVSIDTPMNLQKNHLDILGTFANLIAVKLNQIRADNKIENLAYYDQLTELPNRVLFNDRLEQALALAKRNARLLVIVYLDLDSFKTVNDSMGHSGGDKVILDVARKLTENVRASDTVARFGGDEFLILFNDIADSVHINEIVHKTMQLFSSPFVIEGQEYFITASAGVSVYPFDGEDIDTLIKNADIAMYMAKSRGANQYVLCTPEMKEEVQNSMTLANSLYRALERGEFLLHYQPQIQIETGMVIGLEALLRWNHPTLGMIPPSVFIPLAEKSGLINSIGEWVLQTACRQNKAWQDRGLPHMRMAVNLSVIQFRNPKLAGIIEAILRDTGLSPQDLELEITESAAIDVTGYIVNTLTSLKQLGVSISIDDFGTEYSSLNRLKDFPIDRLKIDMQFIRGLESSEKNQAITMIIINLAKNLGLRVIAEGVETETQLQFLKAKDCDEVQGYYFYKPMPPEEIDCIISAVCSSADQIEISAKSCCPDDITEAATT